MKCNPILCFFRYIRVLRSYYYEYINFNLWLLCGCMCMCVSDFIVIRDPSNNILNRNTSSMFTIGIKGGLLGVPIPVVNVNIALSVSSTQNVKR